MSTMVERVREAGVVGAGGAGFPTYVKLQAAVDTYICNAAECEPLLYKDQELMRLEAEAMVRGMRIAMAETGAKRGVIAVKEKYERAIDALSRHMGPDMEFHYFGSFYPAGDEYVVVTDVTGRLIPVGGLPKDVGCAVNNVETFINIARAADGTPVTHSSLTVTGAVAEPCTMTVPIGVTAEECIRAAGGATVDDWVVFDGGAMMGKLRDRTARVTKRSGGYVVLPRDHQLVRRRTRSPEANKIISQSACDQCSYCTEFCPRYLLGYAIEPHKVMRSVGFAGEAALGWQQLGLQCCECNLCSLYACPEDLPVMEMCIRSKDAWKAADARPPLLPSTGKPHPMRKHRRVPISRLITRLGLTAFDRPAPFDGRTVQPSSVYIPLTQHIGVRANPVVATGRAVRVGDVLAQVPTDKLGTPVHASIDGTVSAIDEDGITIRRSA
ncbi:MAG: Na+-translocating ferredoxin:NAD+ oxidoreductase RnfC subunit [Myxococcota bacterium]|jgi:Na+-translocating ferredoxin:NAD+ oxidoreductase RnfC subunit